MTWDPLRSQQILFSESVTLKKKCWFKLPNTAACLTQLTENNFLAKFHWAVAMENSNNGIIVIIPLEHFYYLRWTLDHLALVKSLMSMWFSEGTTTPFDPQNILWTKLAPVVDFNNEKLALFHWQGTLTWRYCVYEFNLIFYFFLKLSVLTLWNNELP